MKRLLTYLRPYKGATALAVLMLMVAALAQVALPFLTQYGIDNYIEVKNAHGLGLIALAYLGVMVIMLAATYGQTYITMWLGQKVQYDIRMQMYRHLQRLHLQFYDRNPVGRLLTRVTNDVNVLNDLFSSGVVTIVGDVLTLVFIVIALLYYNWKLALVTFTALPLLMAATFVFRAKVRNVYREVRLTLARANAFLQEHLTGMKIVQLFAQEKNTGGKFDTINAELRNNHFRSVLYYAVFFPTVEFIGALSLATLVYYSGFRIADGTLTFGALVAFIQLVQRFYRPIADLAEKYNILQASMASSERIFGLLDTEPAIVDVASPHRPVAFNGRIQIENLWFAYTGEDWVLRDVSFDVDPGQRVAIVGATGAGKTSLISLLYRFYDYQKGAIRIDGVPITQLEMAELRSHLGLVLQDVFLFSGDLAGNVRLRDQTITDEQIEKALERVGFSRFLAAMPDGLRSEIKERGATLSTGQKQLLSFARALAFNPDILILDEATSSVDTETEKLIQRALDTLMEGRTSIIIAHRLSTIEKADKIVVLHHGQVREIGRHADLMQQKGIYYRLYQMQYKKQMEGELKTAQVSE
ncbi:antibiotic ABC transporter ATP-binding protein [candidate division GN15 bacterium]|uniref:Antibiotic ABC transporter ATP-binding protein n=1 Tax=candidate division GN15 bacterium TaxID=2072418 RepID=A0A855X1V2_9BACT|nr:MAG: antibiotic ABC transporter ATP-binding protein [candidate division GN15 bacterium]